MIREVETLEAAARRPPLAAPGAPPDETVENEINRLTWAVLDGSASPSDRNRLTDLVRMQHSHRPRMSA